MKLLRFLIWYQTTHVLANSCPCEAVVVLSSEVCDIDGNSKIDTSKYDRQATYDDAVQTQSTWESFIPQWGIVGIDGGKVDGAGYGGKIHDEEPADGVVKCDFGEYIMCLVCPTTTTTTSTTTGTTTIETVMVLL